MKIKKIFSLFILALIATGTTAVAETAATDVDGKKISLWETTNTSTPYRIPAITTASNGNVIAVTDYRPCGQDIGYGEVDLQVRVSSDNGATWGSAVTIADGTGTSGAFNCGFGDAAVVADRESSKVLVMAVAGNVVYSNGSSSSHNHMARIVSEDNGATWSDPVDVTSHFWEVIPDAYTMFITSGRITQSRLVKTGDYYRLYAGIQVKASSSGQYIIYSDDFGTTWNILGNAYCATSGGETQVEELPNGDVVASVKKDGGRYYNVYSFSDFANDKASGSWGTFTACSFGGSNSTNGAFVVYPDVYDATTGEKTDIILQSLPLGEKSSILGYVSGEGRDHVSVFYKALESKDSYAVSDFTSGWTKGIEVDDAESAYSSMDIQADGNIAFLYEDNYVYRSSAKSYADIVYLPLTVEEITGGAYTTTAPTTPDTPEEPETKSYTVTPQSAEINGKTYYIATFSAAEAVTLPDGVTAYSVEMQDATTASLVKYSGSVLPAEEGVILTASSTDALTLTETDETATSISGNLLVGTVNTALTVDATTYGSVYVLADSTSGVAFYRAAEGFTVPANRAYLGMTAQASEASARAIILSFDDNEGIVTGIEEIDADNAPVEYYNLQGVKVENPEKGIFIKKQGGKAVKVVL